MATYRGHIQNGAVVLDDPIDLPDGTEVKVDAAGVDEDEGEALRNLHPELRRFLGILPRDLDLRKEYCEGMLRKHQ